MWLCFCRTSMWFHLGEMVKSLLVSNYQGVWRMVTWLCFCVSHLLSLSSVSSVWKLVCAWLTHNYNQLCVFLCLLDAVCHSNKIQILVLKKEKSFTKDDCTGLLVRKYHLLKSCSVLKQGHKGKRGSMWSSPVRRKYFWRIPVAMDKVLWKKSKMMDDSLFHASILVYA